MNKSLNLSKKSFAVYGLGSTGKSVIDHFNKLKIKKYFIWDDNKVLKKKLNLNETINVEILKKLKIINKNSKKLKILGKGEIKSKVSIKADLISKSAIEKLKKIGGSFQVNNK